MNSSVMRQITVLTLFLFLFFGCSVKTREKAKTTPQVSNTAEPGWIMLFDGKSLDGWQATEFGTQGPVKATDGYISLGMGDGCTGITWEGKFPAMDYEVKLEAKKVTGNDFFCGMTFPVGDAFCSLIVGGWGGPVTGLSSIDGRDASENETSTLKKYDHDTWYNIHLKVTTEKIEVRIDGETVVDFSYTGRQLSIRPEVELCKPFGICSWTTTAHLRNIRLKENFSD